VGGVWPDDLSQNERCRMCDGKSLALDSRSQWSTPRWQPFVSNALHVCWTEVTHFRSHRFVGTTRVASWDNQLAKTHAVAVVGGIAEDKTACGRTIEGEVLVERAFADQDLLRRCYRCAELLGLPVPPD